MIKNALFTSLIASTNALSQTLLDRLKGQGDLLSDVELDFVGLNFDGPFWTSWSDDYGCENLISRADLCAYPGRYKLRKTRYKECIHPDNRNYPMRILDPNSPNYFKYRTILGGTDDQIRNDYVNFIQSKPQFSIQSPAGDMDDSMEVRYAATKSFYKNTGIKCGTDDFSKNCQAPSVATECDPRIAEYAKQNGISEEDAVALWEIQETDSRWGTEWGAYPRNPIRLAIPEIKINERADTICDDRCPIPLPFTASNCKCETGSSFRGSESEAVDRSCDCDESPVRAQLCFDPDLSDDVDCESVGIDMLRKFPDECIVNPNPLISESTSSYVSYTTTNNPFTAHLLEDWYNNMPRFSRQQNLYSMSDWISTDDIDTPWRGLRVRTDAAEKLKANNGLNSIRNAISNLIEGSNSQIRINVQRLKTLLITENLVDVREVTTDPSPVSKFMTNFAASTRKDSRVDGSANRMYDFSDDLKFNWGQACDKNNPDEIITISKATLYLTETKYADNRETILIDIPSTNIQEEKIEAVVRIGLSVLNIANTGNSQKRISLNPIKIH